MLIYTIEDGGEYWSARELFQVLEYNSWDKFKNVIEKAITARENSKQLVDNHFSQTGKMAQLGLGTQKKSPVAVVSYYCAGGAAVVCPCSKSPLLRMVLAGPLSPFMRAISSEAASIPIFSSGCRMVVM